MVICRSPIASGTPITCGRTMRSLSRLLAICQTRRRNSAMPADEVVATVREAWGVLKERNVPAALMGGLALTHWGHVRSTQDVDLLIALVGVRTHSLLARLAASGFRSKRGIPLIRLEDADFIQLWYTPPNA